MELSDGTLTVSRELSELDKDVLEFIRILDACKVDYVIVSGYVAILTGRSRSTEDIDVILESLSETETEQLVTELKDHGYWGMAMPLDEMYPMLNEGSRIRIAEEGEMYPNFETWFVSNDVEREALSNPLTVTFDEGQIEISPLELQIAYKLRLAQAADSLSGKDFEDALHLYLTFEERFNTEQLETYVKELGVEDYYAELTGV
ncbi:hypothetical protein [Halobacterium salinarum]|uniref:hypothetical protein n=1 Tax=Halobacterium salinarum TaxID=2242 RepID=UPI00255282D2|nr:hypothetical protein [Halobacterium salinarum]MDL0129228.1 hypothetical protein [Halobacterium salinarum]MDL0136100.1 hypothetical protein [Halobacterium salinarum]MDL0140794.1 hypothetical protein [Halobacterium salinarum]MDL0141717.1 hypothetical protein [Halobacterium salinarum]